MIQAVKPNKECSYSDTCACDRLQLEITCLIAEKESEWPLKECAWFLCSSRNEKIL